MGNRGVVDQNVHPSKRLMCLVKQPLDLLMLADVRCDCNRRPAADGIVSGCRLLDTLRMAGIEDNIVPLFPEQLCGLFANAAP